MASSSGGASYSEIFFRQISLARAGEIWRAKVDAFEPPPLDDAIRAELDDFVARRRRELGD